jgi:hypothetical protein
MAIELAEKGRSLCVTVGGEIEFLFPPLSSQDGMQIALHLFGTVAAVAADDFGVDPTKSGEALIDLVLGDHKDAVLELRAEEVTQIHFAVQMWQVTAGGYDLAKLSVTNPKAAVEQWAFAASRTLNLSLSSGARTATNADAGSTPES